MGEYVNYFRRLINVMPKNQFMTIEEMQKDEIAKTKSEKMKIGY